MKIERDFLDIPIITDGDGTKYLADDGEYKEFISGGGKTRIFNLSEYLDGIRTVFPIDESIEPGTPLLLFYGTLQTRGINYTVDFVNHTLTIPIGLEDAPFDTNNNRQLILVAGDIAGTGEPIIGTSIHGELTGRNAADQHPKSAITGLLSDLTTLNQKVTVGRGLSFRATGPSTGYSFTIDLGNAVNSLQNYDIVKVSFDYQPNDDATLAVINPLLAAYPIYVYDINENGAFSKIKRTDHLSVATTWYLQFIGLAWHVLNYQRQSASAGMIEPSDDGKLYGRKRLSGQDEGEWKEAVTLDTSQIITAGKTFSNSVRITHQGGDIQSVGVSMGSGYPDLSGLSSGGFTIKGRPFGMFGSDIAYTGFGIFSNDTPIIIDDFDLGVYGKGTTAETDVSKAGKLVVTDPATNKIPTSLYDAGITSESDPIFTASAAAGITPTNISNWGTAYTNQHTHSNKSVIDGISSTDISNWNGKSNLASPTFTGTPSLPTGTTGVTQTAGTNNTSLATTAFVMNAVPRFYSTDASAQTAANNNVGVLTLFPL